jgi:hypothetical protein
MSEIRKIQPIDADDSVLEKCPEAARLVQDSKADMKALDAIVCPAKRALMTDTAIIHRVQAVLNRQERKRRVALALLESTPGVRCRMVPVERDGGIEMEPAIFRALPPGVQAGILHWFDDDEVWVSLENLKALPKELERDKAILSAVAPDRDQFTEKYPVIVANPTGHDSYAHTERIVLDQFNFTADPVSENVNWTLESGGGYWEADGSQMIAKLPGAVTRQDHYSYNITPDSADYSSQIVSDAKTGASDRNAFTGATVRQQPGAATAYRFAFIDGGTRVLIQRWNAGNGTNLVAETGKGSGTKTLRMEAVGTGASVSLVGYYDGESNNITAVDSHASRIVTTGKPGVHGTLGDGYTGDLASADDFAVYVMATGDDEERDIILAQNRIIRQTNQVLWHGVH